MAANNKDKTLAKKKTNVLVVLVAAALTNQIKSAITVTPAKK